MTGASGTVIPDNDIEVSFDNETDPPISILGYSWFVDSVTGDQYYKVTHVLGGGNENLRYEIKDFTNTHAGNGDWTSNIFGNFSQSKICLDMKQDNWDFGNYIGAVFNPNTFSLDPEKKMHVYLIFTFKG